MGLPVRIGDVIEQALQEGLHLRPGGVPQRPQVCRLGLQFLLRHRGGKRELSQLLVRLALECLGTAKGLLVHVPGCGLGLLFEGRRIASRVLVQVPGLGHHPGAVAVRLLDRLVGRLLGDGQHTDRVGDLIAAAVPVNPLLQGVDLHLQIEDGGVAFVELAAQLVDQVRAALDEPLHFDVVIATSQDLR